ncbi:hypothetical protein SAMN02745163_00798 [Clostridium cavendishii DSM 21758]|uniref:Uncharacterized protein n=1 Tax=Clostridium cavendishii DSM 21758 TaxID=1121302 RepID=A0A1M6E9V4_9CLOT|nr:hypothetical protein [Clostridium cavendishii]SHI82231.1 hypothetical protein SAMN02745163_00798 [Clostridium cavendishii DSM 21758]
MNFQDLIKDYSSEKEKHKALEKYLLALNFFFSLDKIYILVSDKCSLNDIKEKSIEPYISESKVGNNFLALRVFSDKDIACKAAIKHNLITDNIPLIAEIEMLEVMLMTRNLFPLGIYSIVIDEGSNWICDLTSNIVKRYFDYIGKNEFFTNTYIRITYLMNYIWRGGETPYIIELKPKETSGFLGLFKKNKPIEPEKNVYEDLVFVNKSTAENFFYSADNVLLQNNYILKPLNKFEFYNHIIKITLPMLIENITIKYKNESHTLNAFSLLDQLNEIGFYGTDDAAL